MGAAVEVVSMAIGVGDERFAGRIPQYENETKS
jgi:hypothetical protein